MRELFATRRTKASSTSTTPAVRSGRAEDTGGDEQTDGREHGGKAAPVQHGVYHIGAGLHGKAAVHHRQDVLQALALKYHRQHGAHSDACYKRGNGGLLQQDQRHNHRHRQQQHRLSQNSAETVARISSYT